MLVPSIFLFYNKIWYFSGVVVTLQVKMNKTHNIGNEKNKT